MERVVIRCSKSDLVNYIKKNANPLKMSESGICYKLKKDSIVLLKRSILFHPMTQKKLVLKIYENEAGLYVESRFVFFLNMYLCVGVVVIGYLYGVYSYFANIDKQVIVSMLGITPVFLILLLIFRFLCNKREEDTLAFFKKMVVDLGLINTDELIEDQ